MTNLNSGKNMNLQWSVGMADWNMFTLRCNRIFSCTDNIWWQQKEAANNIRNIYPAQSMGSEVLVGLWWDQKQKVDSSVWEFHLAFDEHLHTGVYQQNSLSNAVYLFLLKHTYVDILHAKVA